LTIILSVADVGIPGGRRRKHAYCHGEFSKEKPGDWQDASRHSSSAGHHHVIAGDYLQLGLLLSLFL